MSNKRVQEEALAAFDRKDYAQAAALFERLAAKAPEAWLHVIRCREFLNDQPGVSAATEALRSAANEGNAPAAFAMHLLTRETAAPYATAEAIKKSRSYLHRAAATGFPPAVAQLRADRQSGLEGA